MSASKFILIVIIINIVIITINIIIIIIRFRSTIGILGPACSDTVEPIAGVSKHFKTVVISYRSSFKCLQNLPHQYHPYHPPHHCHNCHHCGHKIIILARRGQYRTAKVIIIIIILIIIMIFILTSAEGSISNSKSQADFPYFFRTIAENKQYK